MVDKIVQLVDVNNNNVFPVAGSLKQGSVTTSTINNGAVTTAKIDYTTLKGSSNVPIAMTLHKMGGNDGHQVRLTRIGNIVIVNCNYVRGTELAADGYGHQGSWGLFPEGYRPPHAAYLPLTNPTPGGGMAAWTINSDGTKRWSCNGWSGNHRLYGNAAWVTTDAWPTT